MTNPNRRSRSSHHLDLRKEPIMLHFELRLAEALERQALLRAARQADRAALAASRSYRHRIGESLMRLGRRIGGETMTSPAWQG